jgi:glycosyltransferase involved in cell wall biosynthesis
MTYLSRFRKSWFVPKILSDFRGIVYSTTEHVYDVLPALKVKGFDKSNVWVAVVHWVAPLRRKEASWLNSILFFFNQRMGFRYIKNGADVILAISQNTAEQLQQIGISRNVFSIGAGVDYLGIREIASKIRIKKYDAVFMKRFDGTKGVFDLMEIWRDVARVRKDATLCMVGLGTRDVMNKLREMVEAFGIEKNVDFLGPIYDFRSKFSVLASSKLFVLPSYEENWAIAIGEAMAAGVPVICYNLPAIKPIWHSNVTWVPKGNKSEFAERVIGLLSNEDERRNRANNGTRYIRKYSWSSIADTEMSLILDCARAY